MMRALFLSLLLPVAAFGELFSLGGIVGTPLTDVTQTTTVAGVAAVKKSDLYTIGPSLQISLPAGFRVEIDALYRPVAYQLATETPVLSKTPVNVSASQFRFPVLLQHHLGKFPLIKPYAEAGLSFDHIYDLSQAATLLPTHPGAIVKTTNAGLVLGLGADIKVPFVRITPEIRYTRQFSSDFQGISELNQAEVLVGIRF
jgi:hypothetical protein